MLHRTKRNLDETYVLVQFVGTFPPYPLSLSPHHTKLYHHLWSSTCKLFFLPVLVVPEFASISPTLFLNPHTKINRHWNKGKVIIAVAVAVHKLHGFLALSVISISYTGKFCIRRSTRISLLPLPLPLSYICISICIFITPFDQIKSNQINQVAIYIYIWGRIGGSRDRRDTP